MYLVEGPGRLLGGPANTVLDHPIAVFEPRGLRVDTGGELGRVVEKEECNRVEDHLLGSNLARVDHDLIAALVALPEPQPRIGKGQLVGALTENVTFELFVYRFGQRSDRIEYRHRDEPDQKRDEHGWAQELPNRNSRGASDNEFVVAGQTP